MNTPGERAAALRSREGWKYKSIRKLLENYGLPYVFEMPLNRYIFDLALPSLQLLVEFDGKYHACAAQAREDEEKGLVANKNGWAVVHIRVRQNAVIPAVTLRPFLK